MLKFCYGQTKKKLHYASISMFQVIRHKCLDISQSEAKRFKTNNLTNTDLEDSWKDICWLSTHHKKP